MTTTCMGFWPPIREPDLGAHLISTWDCDAIKVSLSSDEVVELLNEIQLLAAWALVMLLNAIYPVDKLVSRLEFGSVKHADEI
jgi:hypothetical protein